MLETNPGETVVKLDFQEGRSIEFKTMVNDNAVKTVAAFANSISSKKQVACLGLVSPGNYRAMDGPGNTAAEIVL